ncbi:MAG: hypothetical protein AAF160_01940 [Pseudomonadota bacterium]
MSVEHDYSQGRGWAEVFEHLDGEFSVYDWSEHYDSGYLIGVFQTRPEAVRAAKRWAREHGRKMETAEIIPLPTKGGGQ